MAQINDTGLGGAGGLNASEDAAELKLGDDFQNVQAMSVGEVDIILKFHQKQKQSEADIRGSDIQESEIVNQTIRYTERVNRYHSKEAVQQTRNILLQLGLHEFEIASITNLCPQSVDEVFTLIPSMKRFSDDRDRIDSVLKELDTLRQLS